MYENETFEEIQRRTLARVDNSYDKRESSVIYTATAPASAELAQMYIAMEGAVDRTFADTAPREDLIRRASERGLTPYAATYAVAIGVFNIDVPIGSRFSSERYNWTVTEKIELGRFYLSCETAGDAPNGERGTLIPIEYIDGLQSATLESIAVYGEDEEATEDFRERYYDSFSGEAFGGNRKDYYDKITSIQGVGGCKLYRATNEEGELVGSHVLAVITDSQNGVPTPTLVENVQELIDPLQDQAGDGLAPIGHICHIKAASGLEIDIVSEITYDEGYSFEDLKSHIESAVDTYFSELNSTWDSQDKLIVRTSVLESRILEIPGIIDITGTTFNGADENLTLEENEIAVRGDISG